MSSKSRRPESPHTTIRTGARRRTCWLPTPCTTRKELTVASRAAGEIIEAWQGWAKAFPDSKATFVREFASGDTAVLEIVWKGVHTGPLQTPTGIIPASNKPIEMAACQVVRVEGGKIKSASHYFDMLTMLTQIGATSAVKTAA
jgi:SnoaL-like polyketide cyclase